MGNLKSVWVGGMHWNPHMDSVAALVMQALAANPFLCLGRDDVAEAACGQPGLATRGFLRHIICVPLVRARDPPVGATWRGAMLESYFSYRGVLRRLRSGALGAEMDRIAGYFSSLGYQRASAKVYLSRIARFSWFVAEHCGSGRINEDIVARYLRTFPRGSPRIGAVSALQHARRVAPERFIVAVSSVVDNPDAPLLTSYSGYLSRVRGLEPKSRDGVLFGRSTLLVWLRHDHLGQDLEGLTAEQVLAAVEHQPSLSATSATRTAAVSHIRSFSDFSLG
jgi:hypothetical protein